MGHRKERERENKHRNAKEAVGLDRWPTAVKPLYKSKKQYHHQLEKMVEELSELQRLHYASNRYALLLIFQGMDGAIRHVMSGVNPQRCQVFSLKQPSAEELEHDFLWRSARCLPERKDRHLQSLLLRGSARRARAPGDSPLPAVTG